jgi:hypothetical protein
LAATLSSTADNLVSGWSDTSNKVSLRILCPENLNAGGERSLFWVKCEIRNEGKASLWVTNRARLFLTDDEGKVQRCQRLTAKINRDEAADFNYARALNVGQTCSWWESGQLKNSGHYTLHAVLDELGIKTPSLSVHITVSKTANSQATREAELQRHFDAFPVFDPNVGKSEGTYHCIGFTNDPVVVGGELFYAFRFKAPREPRFLDWSFIQNLERGSMAWYIVPQKGAMEGFTKIDRRIYGTNGVPGLTRSDDCTVFQELPAENFKPGEEYFMWFSPAHGLPTAVMVSLNFPTNDFTEFRATPEAIQERKLLDHVKEQH